MDERETDDPPTPENSVDGSPVPGLVAAGVAAGYLAVALAVVGHARAGAVPLWPVVAVAVGLTLAGVGGWILGLVRRRSGARAVAVARTAALAFVGTETATFGAAVATYAVVRVRAWPPAALPTLDVARVGVLTLVLLASSATIQAAGPARDRWDAATVGRTLAATAGLGCLFLVGQAGEYYTRLSAGFGPEVGTYAGLFYLLTGLHWLHVAAGVLALVVLWSRTRRGTLPDASLRAVTVYWHFVDTVWLVLVATLYVGAQVTV
ncbi:cytochrome c oxidase subunit 3 [Halorientalis pallida]|uniref:cytochrome c oxidase subunit 3 n=1 Tax=Halorientalis pallida TaxID=2479928 RepID=UPI003C6F7284